MSLWQLAERFAIDAGACANMLSLHDLLADAALALGFRHFALVHSLSFRATDPHLIKLDNYPLFWSDRFTTEKLYLDDPVLLASQRAGRGFAWHEISQYFRVETRHEAVLEAGAAQGLGTGFTLPVHIPGEAAGSCSFATRRGVELAFGNFHCAGIVGGFAFETARRLVGISHLPSVVPHLSPRQYDCIRLIARGLSNKQIARALEISPETVHDYVMSSFGLLGVSSRTSLAVQALRLNLIGFEDIVSG